MRNNKRRRRWRQITSHHKRSCKCTIKSREFLKAFLFNFNFFFFEKKRSHAIRNVRLKAWEWWSEWETEEFSVVLKMSSLALPPTASNLEVTRLDSSLLSLPKTCWRLNLNSWSQSIYFWMINSFPLWHWVIFSSSVDLLLFLIFRLLFHLSLSHSLDLLVNKRGILNDLLLFLCASMWTSFALLCLSRVYFGNAMRFSHHAVG